MSLETGYARCLSFINCQLQAPRLGAYHSERHRRAVTISRQTGSGGHTVAEKLAVFLQANLPHPECSWTVFDRNLVEEVLSEHHLPDRLARFMPEDRITELTDTMDELFGLHPPSWHLVRKSSETILHLAEMGNVILLGRGANVITRNLDYVFHVRLVGSLQKRIRRIQDLDRMSAPAARALVEKEDLGRRRYLKKYFNQDIDNPLLYHLVLNTDVVSFEEAARIIGEAILPVGKLANA